MKEMEIRLRCPYYDTNGIACRGETLANGFADVTISVVCSKCGRVYLANLYKMMTWERRPQKRDGRK